MGALDDAKNKAQDLAGKAKEKVGELTGDHDLEAEGKKDQAASSAKSAGQKAKDAGSEIKDAVTE